jgi:DNA modification methylase
LNIRAKTEHSAVETRPTADLTPYGRNARTHSDHQIDQIAASIREFGFTNPVLVDGENGIIAGHGRVLAARKLGLEAVPVIELAHLSAEQKRAYILADNQLALNAGWDLDILGDEWGALKSAGFDMDLLGFDDIDALLRGQTKAGLTDPDDVPAVPAVPVSALGDVWTLGKHRLVCGDSTEAETVAKVLKGAKPHLMVADPPYGVNVDPSWRIEAVANHRGKARRGLVTNDDQDDWVDAWRNFPGDVAYVWHADQRASVVADSLLSVGFEIRAQIIWLKHKIVISRGHYHPRHEPCWYAVRKGATGHWSGDRTQSTVWEISHQKSDTGHSTQKPVECMRQPMVNNSTLGDAVYDPFVGSGTSIIAAEMTGRQCLAIEIDPAYVDVAVTRWQDFTGGTAIHEASGETFADRKAALGIEAPEVA